MGALGQYIDLLVNGFRTSENGGKIFAQDFLIGESHLN